MLYTEEEKDLWELVPPCLLFNSDRLCLNPKYMESDPIINYDMLSAWEDKFERWQAKNSWDENRNNHLPMFIYGHSVSCFYMLETRSRSSNVPYWDVWAQYDSIGMPPITELEYFLHNIFPWPEEFGNLSDYILNPDWRSILKDNDMEFRDTFDEDVDLFHPVGETFTHLHDWFSGGFSVIEGWCP